MGRRSGPKAVACAVVLSAIVPLASACAGPTVGTPPTPFAAAPKPTVAVVLPPLTPAPGVPGQAERGRQLFFAKGCAGCHTISAHPLASGVAGPNLTNVVLRPTLANGVITTTPENLTRWVLDPPAVKPDTAMPSLGLTPEEAWDITSFLYSQPRNPGR